MSSLIDDLNSRAYASADSRMCHCSSCDAAPEPGCRVCGHDCIPLDDDSLCATCRPLEDETCDEWTARVRGIRGRG